MPHAIELHNAQLHAVQHNPSATVERLALLAISHAGIRNLNCYINMLPLHPQTGPAAAAQEGAVQPFH